MNGGEALLPALELIRSTIVAVNPAVAAVPRELNVEVPAAITEWLGQLSRHLEELIGREKGRELELQNAERMLKQAEHRHKLDEERVSETEKELSRAQERISSLESEKGKEANALGHLGRELESALADLALTRGRLERSEREKLELARLLEVKQGEQDSLNTQLEALIKRQSQLRQDVLEKEAGLEDARRQLSSTQLQLVMLEQQSEAVRKQSEWSASELDRTIAELKAYRKQKTEEMGALRASLEAAQGNAVSLERQLYQAKASLGEREEKLEQLMQELLHLKEESAEKDKTFMDEMSTKGRLAELYKGAGEESQQRIEELEARLEEAQPALQSFDERIAQIEGEALRREEQLATQLKEKEVLVESLRGQIAGDAAILSGSAAAAMATVVKTSDKSQTFSQVYAELTQCRTGLLEASQENERLKACLRDICEDIEARLPAIQADREENVRLKSTVSSLSERMLALSQERDRLNADLLAAKRTRETASKEARALERQVADLGLQVQRLLGSQPAVIDSNPAVVDAQQIITDRLVTVGSVAELQVRNQELLRVVRELAERAEIAEAQLAKGSEHKENLPEVQQQLKEALQEVAQLREARAKQSALVDRLASRSIASMPAATNSAIDLTNEPIESVRNEADVKQLESECVALRASLLKAEARGNFAQERLEMLRANYEASRQEFEQSRAAAVEQSKATVKLQGELQTMLGEVLEAREAGRRAESQLALIKSSFAASQASEKRLAEEKDGLQGEKQRLSSLLSSLQGMLAESEAAGQLLRERLTSQVEFLERELRETRRRLEETLESHRLEVAALGRENKELQEKIHRLYEEAARSRQPAVPAVVNTSVSSSSEKDDVEGLKGLLEATQASLMQVSQALDQTREEADKGMAELQEASDVLKQEKAVWEAERQDLLQRLDSLAEAETRLQELRDDASKQEEVLAECRARLAEETSGHRAAQEQVQSLQADLRAAQSSLDLASSECERLKQTLELRKAELQQQASTAESTQKSLTEKIAELEGLLAAKFTSTAAPSEGEGEVVGYLRKQKDALQAELTMLQADNRRLLAQLDQTKGLLEETRARLAEESTSSQWQTQMATAYEEMQARLAALSSLKESNVELLGQVEALQSRLASTQRDLARSQAEGESLASQLLAAQAAAAMHEEHLRVLRQERDLWKSRSSAPSIEAEEQQQQRECELVAERDALLQHNLALEQKAKRIALQCQHFKTQSDEHRRKAERLEEAANAMQQEGSTEAIKALEAQLASTKETLAAVEAERNDFSTKLARYNVALQRLNGLKEEYAKLKVEHEAALKSNAGAEELKKEHEMLRSLLTSQWQARVAKLQEQVKNLQAQLNSVDDEPTAKRAKAEAAATTMVSQEVTAPPPPVHEEKAIDITHSEQDVYAHDEEEEGQHHDGEELEDGDEMEEDEEMEPEALAIMEEHGFMMEETERGSADLFTPGQILHDELGMDVRSMVEQADLAYENERSNVTTPPLAPEVPVAQEQPPQLQPPTPVRAIAEEDFDIDQFLIDQDIGPPQAKAAEKPATKPTPVVFAPASSTATTSRTINLPVSSSTTMPTFTPTPIQPPPAAPKGRIIDLSQTGRKPLPTTAVLTPSTNPPQTTSSVRGGKPMVRGRVKKFKRGGGSTGGGGGSNAGAGGPNPQV